MMTTTPPPSSWSALPNLRAFSVNEGLRLSLMAISLVFVILAGQLAQSRSPVHLTLSSELQSQSQAQAPAQPITASPTRVHRTVMSENEHYARSQIKMFSELLDGLTERAEDLIDSASITEQDSVKLKSSLQVFDEDLMQARQALLHSQKSRDPFSDEELRASLFTVQESASHAQSEMITLDQTLGQQSKQLAQGFNVNRIGQ